VKLPVAYESLEVLVKPEYALNESNVYSEYRKTIYNYVTEHFI